MANKCQHKGYDSANTIECEIEYLIEGFGNAWKKETAYYCPKHAADGGLEYYPDDDLEVEETE